MTIYLLVGLGGLLLGFLLWILPRGFFTVNQDQRAVKTTFGKAKRLLESNDDPNIFGKLNEEEKGRYNFPKIQVIQPGGPYFKWPWQKVYKVTIATQTANIAYDPESRAANKGNTLLEAITKDQLNIDLSGQIRYRVSEGNLYAYLFGVRKPICHVMGYFVSVLREKIAGFNGKSLPTIDKDDDEPSPININNNLMEAATVSINDLRKNLREINEHMDRECMVSEGRYGVILEASLITGIDPPDEVESALAAINTAHNQVSSEISLAHAAADQRIVQSKRAVEIATLQAESETEGLILMSKELANLYQTAGKPALDAYVRNAKLSLFNNTQTIYQLQDTAQEHLTKRGNNND